MLFALLGCRLGGNDTVGGLCRKSNVARGEIVPADGGSYEGLNLRRERDDIERKCWRTLNTTAGSHDGHCGERIGLVRVGGAWWSGWRMRLLGRWDGGEDTEASEWRATESRKEGKGNGMEAGHSACGPVAREEL